MSAPLPLALFQDTPEFKAFIQYRSHFINACHKNLWVHLVRGYTAVNIEAIRNGLSEKSHLPGGTYTVLSSQEGLIRESNFKTIELGTVLPKRGRSSYLEQIKWVVENQVPYSTCWETSQKEFKIKFDWQDGEFKGWLMEYPERGILNCSVWLITNPTTAVYYLFD